MNLKDYEHLAAALDQDAGIDDAINPTADSGHKTETADQLQVWQELQPLIAKVHAQDYPLDALPDLIRCAVQEVAGFVKAPIPLITTSALAALSLALQAHSDVERADKLRGPSGLFLLAIADSGERKSTCDAFFTNAIKDYEAQQHETAKPLITAYKSGRSMGGTAQRFERKHQIADESWQTQHGASSATARLGQRRTHSSTGATADLWRCHTGGAAIRPGQTMAIGRCDQQRGRERVRQSWHGQRICHAQSGGAESVVGWCNPAGGAQNIGELHRPGGTPDHGIAGAGGHHSGIL